MTGIFPEGGVNPGAAAANAIQGLVEGVDYEAGCPPRYFGNSCKPMFDPAQSNAVISEILNVLRDRGIPYDCSVLDNLSKAIGPHVIAYEKTVHLPTDPWPVKNGTDVVVRGNFTVPNSSGRDIMCIVTSQLTVLIKTLAAGDDENLDVDLKLSGDNSYAGNLMYTTIQMRRSGAVDYDSWQTVKVNIFNIPAGGRQFFYELSTTTTDNLSFELKEDQNGCKWKFYGISHTTSDILVE